MIIDNFNSIYVWLEHLNEGDFYWIQIYCCKKDSNNISDKIVIKNYIIFSIKDSTTVINIFTAIVRLVLKDFEWKERDLNETTLNILEYYK